MTEPLCACTSHVTRPGSLEVTCAQARAADDVTTYEHRQLPSHRPTSLDVERRGVVPQARRHEDDGRGCEADRRAVKRGA